MPQPISLGAQFIKTCQSHPQATALIYSSGRQLEQRTFSEVRNEIADWCGFFRQKGVKPGDRIAAISPKSANHYRFFYACWCYGAIAVPICETLAPQEMSFIIQDCAPDFILVDPGLKAKVQANAGDIECIDWTQLPIEREISGACCHPDDFNKPRLQAAELDIDEVAVLIYTSGSTGLPKGVMLTHRNIWMNSWSALEFYRINAGDSVTSLLPYWHAFALICEIGCTVMANAICIIPKDIRDFKKNLASYQPTIILAVPRIIDGFKAAIDKAIHDATPKKKALIEKAIYNASRIFTAGPKLNGGFLRYITHYCFYDPLVFRQFRKAFGGRLRAVVCGGASLDLELQIFFKYIGVPLFQGYGLSEASPVVSSNIWEHHMLGSCGQMMPWLKPEHGGDYTFKDEDGNLGKDLRGQLLVKGQCVMKGYWNHTDASAKTMEDGWLNTGDVGHCDSQGNLYIHGRKGNMIVLNGGEKFHPEPVEDAVKNSPMIAEAMVIGEKCKNVYICVNVPDDVRKQHPDDDELHRLLRDEVARTTTGLTALQKPKDVLLLPDFTTDDGTLTASLKIRRFKIMELYRKQIEDFLTANGEDIATKHELGIASTKVMESLGKGDAIVGLNNVIN